MNAKALCAALAALFVVVNLAAAEDAAETPASEKPEITATTTVTGADKAQVTCLVKAGDGKDIGCAGNYRRVAEGYLEAYKAMDKWLADASAQVAGAEEKVAALEKSVTENETAMTALKLDRSKDAKAKLKDLGTTNKQLWKDLEAARREQAGICKGFKRDAAQKAKELNADLAGRLAEAQKAE